MCSTSLIFLHLYSRSGIVIRPQNKKANDPAEDIIHVFIETVLYLRMQWHTYIISTQCLDKIIETFYEKRIEPENAIKMMNRIIEIRKDVARGLIDPTTYRTASGSLNIVHECGRKIFRIEELNDIFITRFEMLDKLYNDQKEKLRLSDMRLLDDKFKKFEKQLKLSSNE